MASLDFDGYRASLTVEKIGVISKRDGAKTMLFFRRYELVFGFLLGVAICGIASLTGPAPDKGPKHTSIARSAEDRVADYTWWLGAFTFVLAFSTIGLWIVTWRGSVKQSRDMHASVAVAKNSADAAKRSADAFMSAEMAHLFTQVTSTTVGKIIGEYGRWDKSETMFHQEVETPTVGYNFNTGRTVAMLKEISHQFVLLDGDDFPSVAEYLIADNMPQHRAIMPGEFGSMIGCPFRDTMNVGKCVGFQQRKLIFWFYGYVKFDDVFGREHEWRYRFRYRRGDDGFRLDYFREFPGSAEQQTSMNSAAN